MWSTREDEETLTDISIISLLMQNRALESSKSCIFWVGNFDARYFFGSKISGLCIFLGLQYEAPSDPPVMYTWSTPPPLPPGGLPLSLPFPSPLFPAPSLSLPFPSPFKPWVSEDVSDNSTAQLYQVSQR